LYPETANTKKDSAYTIFYMGINAGAFVAPLVCGYLGENIDFRWGFFAAGIGMLISLVVFYFTKNKYVISHTGEQLGVLPNKMMKRPEDQKEFDFEKNPTGTQKEINPAKPGGGFGPTQVAMSIGAIVAVVCILYFLLGVDFWGSLIYGMTLVGPLAIITDTSLTKVEKSRLTVIIIIMLFVIFFWMCFEQAGASLTFFANEQTNRRVFGWEMPASYFQSFNPIFIVILAPIFATMWGRLGRRGIEPPAPMKQALGLGLLALGFLFISFGATNDPAIKVSIIWLTGLYFLHTVGELFLSPIGLSMVNKLTPGRFTSLMMGIWFLAIATGNKLAGTMSALYPDPKATGPKPVFLGITIDNLHTYFMIFVGFAGAAAIILFLLSFKLRKMMHGIK
jgi:POT family proton-dependent oligopeptide transporter